MDDAFSGFDWDEGNREKCRRHGVSVIEIEDLFRIGPLAVRPDPEHSQAEERLQGIGTTQQGRSVFLVFTIWMRDGDQLIRPISACYMHRKKIEHYEKQNPSLHDR